MPDENLDAELNENWREHKRGLILENLGERLHLTLEQVAKLVSHPDHGEAVKDITLQEVVNEATKGTKNKKKKSKRTRGKPEKKPEKKPAKKTTKKAAKKAAKKTTPKGSKKKVAAAKKVAGKKGPKADKGRPKPRLDYETGCREVLGALKAAGGPVGRHPLEVATGYTGVQVRTFCKRLANEGKARILGPGGRATQYEAV